MYLQAMHMPLWIRKTVRPTRSAAEAKKQKELLKAERLSLVCATLLPPSVVADAGCSLTPKPRAIKALWVWML